MEFRSKKTAGVMAMVAALPALAQQFPARHEHLRKGCPGTLSIDDQGVSFQGRKHKFHWQYGDIQRLELSAHQVRVLTYADDKWKLGADREYRFRALDGADFTRAYARLKDRLDQRFVAALSDENVAPLWAIPAKHLQRFGGTQGTLIVGEDRIVYRAGGDSRTWRYTDVDSISSAGPFQFTLTTFDHDHFNFVLKRPLDEQRYNELWRRLNEKKGSIRLPGLTFVNVFAVK